MRYTSQNHGHLHRCDDLPTIVAVGPPINVFERLEKKGREIVHVFDSEAGIVEVIGFALDEPTGLSPRFPMHADSNLRAIRRFEVGKGLRTVCIEGKCYLPSDSRH
jgi:hypothetical protein